MKTRSTPLPSPPEHQLGLGWSVAVHPQPRGAVFRLSNPHAAPVDVEIVLTPEGPSVRLRAASLEMEAADEIVARCDRFSIEARDRVSISGQRGVEVGSGAGDIRLRANDDVQVLGERVLLNCEREPPVPAWVASPPPACIGRQEEAGDLELLDRDGR